MARGQFDLAFSADKAGVPYVVINVILCSFKTIVLNVYGTLIHGRDFSSCKISLRTPVIASNR